VVAVADMRRETLTSVVEGRVHASRHDDWVRPSIDRALAQDAALTRLTAVADLLREARRRSALVALLGD
jgi:hypothetical protein